MPTKTRAISQKEIKRQWHLVDAQGKVLGRLATEIAPLILGKHKPSFSPHLDCGDVVVVVNAAEVVVTGDKESTKIYWRHSGYPGGLRLESLASLKERRPEEVVRRAVRGMLPKNRLLNERLDHLYVYAGSEHPHQAQLSSKAVGSSLDSSEQLGAGAQKEK